MQNDEKKVKKSFFQGMKAELKKVIWPTGKQTVKSTFVTIGFVLLISAVLIVLNLFFSFLSTQWYGLILGENEHTHDHTNINQVISGDASGENTVTDVSGEASGENIESEETESVEVSGEDTSIVE